MPQKVKVTSLAAELPFPDQKGKGSLQREIVPFWKLSEPVQETLQRKASQDHLVIFSRATGAAQKTVTDGLRNAAVHGAFPN